MYENKKFVAIIPARSGSKGLKDKNIRELNGKPMIAYTIEAAKKSNIFDKIIVSTDSERYREISKRLGAAVPFMRPDYLSTDEASSLDVIEHMIINLRKVGEEFDFFMLLQPTSPLRNEKDILGAVNLLFKKQANAIVSVCEVDHPPFLVNKLDNSLSLESFFIRNTNIRRQDSKNFYRINGAIYLSRVDYFIKYKNFYKTKCYAYIMPRERSVDVDTEIDFKLVEVLMKQN